MTTNIKLALGFISGVVVGVAATYKYAEKKFAKIADDEIESILELYSNRKKRVVEDEVSAEENIKVAENRKTPLKPSLSNYKSTVEKYGYNTISKQATKEEIEPEPDVVEEEVEDTIYVIPPEEFDTLRDYAQDTLYYTTDGFVIDIDNDRLNDDEIQRYIGGDPVGRFGEYEDDCVHIRNEERKVDCEILRSPKTLAEIQEG